MVNKLGQRGFTLPELLAVIVVLVIGAVLAGFLLRPASYDLENYQAERQLSAARLSQALTKYRADNGSWPDGLTANFKTVGSDKDQLNLCAALVPKYLEDIPADPLAGYNAVKDTQEFTDKPCSDAGVIYDSGIQAALSPDGRLTVKVPGLQDFPEIKITR